MHGGVVRCFGAVLLVCCVSTVAFVYGVANAQQLPQLSFDYKFSKHRNSPDYHKLRAQHDFARHGRELADVGGGLLTFYDGNVTIPYYDGLVYSIIDVGTPSELFFVALETRTDLFWIPCECISCATPNDPTLTLKTYTPINSSTSAIVTCGDSECLPSFSTCPARNLSSSDQCTYEVLYSVNTSTSGILFEDVLHFIPNSASDPISEASVENVTVLLGCGRIQTGDFSYGTTRPQGVLGLSRSNISIPSVLASSGLIEDTFSMCFNYDATGTIVFGDVGPPDLRTTPFQPPPPGISSANYYMRVDSISIGNQNVTIGKDFLVDVGSSFSYIETTLYTTFTSSLNSIATQVYNRTTFIGLEDFEFCYSTSTANLTLPTIFFNLAGGNSIPILGVITFVTNQVTGNLDGFCLNVKNGGRNFNLFSNSFMRGTRVVFNREASVIGFDVFISLSQSCNTSVSYSNLAPATSPSPSPGGPEMPPTSASTPSGSPGTMTPGSSGFTPSGGPPAPPPGSFASRPLVSVLSLISSILLVVLTMQHMF